MKTLVNAHHRKQDPPCYLCKGRGQISLVVCKGCGKPAYRKIGDLVFCGESDCKKKLFVSARLRPQRTQARKNNVVPIRLPGTTITGFVEARNDAEAQAEAEKFARESWAEWAKGHGVDGYDGTEMSEY